MVATHTEVDGAARVAMTTTTTKEDTALAVMAVVVTTTTRAAAIMEVTTIINITTRVTGRAVMEEVDMVVGPSLCHTNINNSK